MEKRRFAAGSFEGPLDLLWCLIRENKINIFDIPIAQITEQFLQYLDLAQQLDLQDLSEFYFWAAKLVCMKSRLLLPPQVRVEESADEVDMREELVEQLIEHQRIKKLSELMEQREEVSAWSFERKAIERMLPLGEETQWQKIDSWTLLLDMQKIFKSLTDIRRGNRIMDLSEDISPKEKIALMSELLDEQGECMFTDLITRRGSALDVVCAFMAILEAVKLELVEIFQNVMFGDIKICKRNRI